MTTPVFCASCAAVVDLPEASAAGVPCPGCGALLETPAGCDVFISYATADLAAARQVATALHAAGIRHWLAPERIGIGESFLTAIDAALQQSRVLVLILSSASVRSPWVRREVTDSVSQRRPVLPLRVEAFDMPREWQILLSHNQWEDAFREAFDVHLDRLVARVQAELRAAAARPLGEPAAPVATAIELAPLEGVNPDVSPYAGPRPFPTRMADRFFGREHEAEALLGLIARSRIVLVYAPSGAGKSSLLNTLICQSLDEQGIEPLLGARVGGALPDNVRAADIANIYSYAAIFGLDATVAPNPRARLTDYLRGARRRPGTRGRVLVLDQFEELFTQHAERFEDRAAFFDDLAAALDGDPTLRIVLAMRQEYLADIDPLAARLPPALAMARFALRRLEQPGALAAITRPAAPYALFAPGVAEEIVRQLNTIRVTGFDGVPVQKQGEFIEMVHLQIVCERLWASLPRGITCIEMAHVERAAGEGRSFDAFVVNALDAFYDDTVDKIVHSRTTLEHGGYSKELVRLGCMKFVTRSATRTMVQRAHGRTGRLPDWIIDQLESSHLLRSEVRGGERWYELAHDRLAEPVGKQMDRRVSALLYAADLLDKVLEKALEENGGTLAGYFTEHREVLLECRPFHGQAGLFPDEAEFLFRASLVAGQQMPEWSARLGADFPDVRVRVLRDALAAPSPAVRHNAVDQLGREPVGEVSAALIDLALRDGDESVRHAAAVSLARLDDAGLCAALDARLADPGEGAAAEIALARMRATADQSVRAPVFEARFAALAPGPRRAIRRAAARLRLRRGLPMLPFIVLPAALLAAIAAAAFKWLPGMLDWALVQGTASAGMGVFHGLTAGFIWAGSITFGVALYYLVAAREFTPRSYVRPTGALAAGLASGFLSSVLIVCIIVSVYEVTSLVEMGWLAGGPAPARFSLGFWRDLFVVTRFGWVHIVTGSGLGIGMALVMNGVRASPRWAAFLERQTGLVGLPRARALLRELVGLTARHVWPLPVMLALAGAAAFLVPHAPPTAGAFKGSPLGIALGIAGDCATQAIGAFFGIVGMGLGIVLVRCGFYFEPRT